MKRLGILTSVAVALFGLTIAGCGGGGGGGTAPKATLSKGVITSFGSVTVNGVKFNVQGATLHLRDTKQDKALQTETEIQNDLKVGMVVTVKGAIDDNGITGKASEIEFRDTLEGNVDNKGVDFITVMGQTILVDDSIKSVLNSISINDDVEVSGLVDNNGQIRGTHIEKKTGLTEFETKGFVSNLTANSFTLLLSPTATSGITVNVGVGVTLPTGLKNGDFVEVKTQTSSGGTITATKVELEDELKAEANAEIEVEGFVTSGTVDDFFINGQEIQTSASTLFRNGAKADFAVGMKLEVEGVMSGTILKASKVTFKESIRIGDDVVSVDTTAMIITILGNKAVSYTTSTLFKDSGNATVDPATLTGKNVEIRGVMNTAGTGIIATRVDLKSNSPANDAFLRGPVSAKTPNTGLTIAGIAVNTTGATFKDTNDNPISGDAFFAAITLNSTVVKVRWNPFNNTTEAVKEAELEN